MSSPLAARLWQGATCVITVFALLTQLILVISGASVLTPEDPPTLPERMVRLLSYFTIQANVLVAVTTFGLLRDPARDGRVWRVVRLAAVVGILVTGIVHWIALRPLLNLTGWSYLCDVLLHVVVPVLAVTGWLIFGPRPRVTLRVVLLALIWPAAWLACTLIRGGYTGWYPYPFLNLQQLGAGPVAVALFGITSLLAVASLLVWLGDRRLPVPSRE